MYLPGDWLIIFDLLDHFYLFIYLFWLDISLKKTKQKKHVHAEDNQMN